MKRLGDYLFIYGIYAWAFCLPCRVIAIAAVCLPWAIGLAYLFGWTA